MPECCIWKLALILRHACGKRQTAQAPCADLCGVSYMAITRDSRGSVWRRSAQRQSALTVLGEWCDLNAAARVVPTRKDGERCDRTIELHDRRVLKHRAATPVEVHSRASAFRR
jgi:hypothetical protein